VEDIVERESKKVQEGGFKLQFILFLNDWKGLFHEICLVFHSVVSFPRNPQVIMQKIGAFQNGRAFSFLFEHLKLYKPRSASWIENEVTVSFT
jgi:hypothetical protein